MSLATTPARLPFLAEICWQIEDVRQLSPLEMLRCYERGWHYRSGPLTLVEQAFIDTLAQQYGSWLNGLVAQQHHQKILSILGQLRASFLSDCQIYFGGGTLLTLLHGEYRLSKDVDFLCASQAGYRQLRRAVFERQYHALFEDSRELSFPREIQTNQYGVRFPVVMADTTIRFEIVPEGRIPFESPQQPKWCPVACLSSVDLVAKKLLDNSDRWPDRSVFSRDLIDLCILRLNQELPPEAIAKLRRPTMSWSRCGGRLWPSSKRRSIAAAAMRCWRSPAGHRLRMVSISWRQIWG